jgi:two-component system OmpR family sensor kinase
MMLISAGISFYVVYTDTGTELRGQIDRDISGDTTQLAQALGAARGQSAAQIARLARRYVQGQPYQTTTTLLFVLIPRSAPSFNHPEIAGERDGDDASESAAQQAQENHEARLLSIPHFGYSIREIPDTGATRILERPVQLGSVTAIAGAGEPLAIVKRAQDGVGRTFVLAGAITLLLALVASYVAGARVSAPLRRMAAVARRVVAGELEPRMQPERGRGEVSVLAEAFNHMLDQLIGELEGQRDFIADASHELRTPITVIRGQLEVLAAQEHPAAEDVRAVEEHVHREITRISRLVDDLLLLAQAEHSNFLRAQDVDLRAFVGQLWEGVSLTAERHFELGSVPSGTLHADPDRVAQALHNLTANAIRHTRATDGLVRLEVHALPGNELEFVVIDDGPGIPPDERERIFERFHRTDPSRSRIHGGAGLGLAIVRAIAESHHGRVDAVEPPSGAGGARVRLRLPGFTASVPRRRPGPAPVP